MKNIRLIFSFTILISSCSMFGQIIITGTIRDCENIPIPGVSILIKETKLATYTNFDGEFTIKANKKNVLVFSFIGYETKEIIVENNDSLAVILKSSSEEIKSILVKKPVIYLYPTQKTDVKFLLDFEGKLQTTFPNYIDNWEIIAYPDGKIFDKKSQRFYSSLFWDGSQNFSKEHYNYQSGFVVSKNDLTNFLIEKLEFIGLNNSETNEFVQYWLPILDKNEINFIHFFINTDYDVISKNNVSPKPDTSIRIFMEFHGLDKPIEIPEQLLSKTERKGFTLVEWGGSDVSKVVKELNTLKL